MTEPYDPRIHRKPGVVEHGDDMAGVREERTKRSIEHPDDLIDDEEDDP